MIYKDDLDAVAGELAAHYTQAGNAEASFRSYRQAAHVALEQHALGQAEALLNAALSPATNDPTKRLHVLHEQNRIFRSSSRFSQWQENLAAIEQLWLPLPASVLDYMLICFHTLQLFHDELLHCVSRNGAVRHQ